MDQQTLDEVTTLANQLLISMNRANNSPNFKPQKIKVKRKYFKGFNFSKLTLKMSESVLDDYEPVENTPWYKGIYVKDIMEVKIMRCAKRLHEQIYLNETLQFLPILDEGLDKVSQETGVDLTMENRELFLVDRVTPRNAEAEKDLIKRYGKYALNGAGDCDFIDGSYQMRIGRNFTLPHLLSLAAHEYGHTLGDTFINKDPRKNLPIIEEELKAMAFSSLFSRVTGVGNCSDLGNLRAEEPAIYADKPHHVARHKLDELLNAGIPEEAIIAHLTNKPFGIFKPENYKVIMKTFQKVKSKQ